MTAYIIGLILQALAAFLIGTLVFDVVHFIFHLFITSKSKILRAIGGLHSAHHRFYSSDLQIKPEWARKNIFHHILIEYLVQLASIVACVYFLNPIAVVSAAIFQTIIFVNVCYHKGVDPRHRPYSQLPLSRGGFLVRAEYHALHHVYPHSYFSSYIKLLDWILGTGHQLKGKKIVMTGANGALGSHMKTLLEKEGASVTAFKYGTDYTYHDYEKLTDSLREANTLLLCHGSKNENAQQANCDSFIKIIEAFRSVHQCELIPVEIWGVGSEIECHPCFGIKSLQPYASSKRNYAKQARKYFRDQEIQYRHIVHSAFWSRMGPGLMTASFAARMTIFLIKRDFKYVPVTYTGFAFLNYLRFLLNI
ncbi:MAG: sterol desaturase family protein [Gammaproteobacteria bacterium]